MGRRKERRLAAMASSGRRVKLDLFAEPSGDLGGSSAKDEIGEDVDAKIDTELPNSPSSSGQQAANPLSLLGQYSDDELDDRSNETTSAPDGSLVDDDNQTKLPVAEELEEGEIGGSVNLSAQKAENHDLETDSTSPGALLVEAGSVSNIVASDEKHHEVNTDSPSPDPEASVSQTAGGVSSCWKMVLHEESNRYYYWNTVTGETSWEVPDVLAQVTGLDNEIQMLGTKMEESAARDIIATTTSATFDVKLDDISNKDSVGYTNGVSDETTVHEHSSTVVGALPYEISTLQNDSLPEQVNAVVGSTAGISEVHGHSTMINNQESVDLPSHLIKHAESLLQRMKLLQRSGADQQGWISKCTLEIEIRLCDLRSLLSHGSSLGPFWLHSERQLNQLENAINSEVGEQNNKINGMHLSFIDPKESKMENEEESKMESKVEDGGEESKMHTNGRKLSSESSCAISHDVDALTVSHDQAYVDAKSEHTHLHFGEERGKEISSAAPQGKASPKAEFQSGEDVDMDIDMEVEEPSPAVSVALDKGGQLVTVSEQLIQSGSEFNIPPPPDEEWIPPPPPDNEEIPPPPPDEPPESCPPPPPSEPEPVQSVYNEHYNLTYTGSNVHYYDNVSMDASGSILHEHADGSQIAVLNPAVYYATPSTVQPTLVPTPAESLVYYGFQNGVMPIVPVEPTVGLSGVEPTSGNPSYDQLSSKQIATSDALAEASSEVPSTSVVSAPTTVSSKEYVSAPFSAATTSVMVTSTSAAVSEVPAPLAKPQSKVSRMKRPKVSVASSLRSNKKVSSLVDKWKAAKEELQEEEEEERETPLEILEKKRRRQIEEWRAQQIASGEAKENANFQPLGGDWRERVKRRRAQKGATVKASLDAPKPSDTTKQPDLNELSRDLPPGWQAYWDDSSSQVYYANSITSETTWAKPTR